MTTASTPLRRTRRARWCCASKATSRAPRSRASTSSSAALPPGPAHRSTQSASGPSSGAAASASGDELAALVLHAGEPGLDGGERPGVALGQPHGVRRPGTGRAAALRRQLVAGQPACDEVHLGARVVGGQGRAGLPQVAAEGVAEGAGDPVRVAVLQREGRQPVVAGASSATHAARSFAATLRRTALTKATGPALTTRRARSTVAETAACCGMRVRSSWWAPSRSTSSTGGSTLASGRSTQACSTAS